MKYMDSAFSDKLKCKVEGEDAVHQYIFEVIIRTYAIF